MRKGMSAQALGWMVGAAALAALSGSPARAGITEPELSVAGGTGVPGGTVSVTLSLADDVDDVAVTAGVDLRFGADALEFFEPVDDSCAVAERLAATHGVAGMLLDPDLLNNEVFVSGAPNPPPSLGNGEIVTCDFRIRDGVPAGTVALEIEAPFLGDTAGGQIPVRVRNGSVQVLSELPTSTPTATSPPPTDTPTATATVTNTRTVTSTATATNPPVSATATATATNTRPTTPPTTPPTATVTATNTPATPATATATATATRTGATPTATGGKKGGGGDGCNVAPVDPGAAPGAATLLLLPALWLWLRRRGL